jgi:cell wall-associated NlpC family hydrolase
MAAALIIAVVLGTLGAVSASADPQPDLATVRRHVETLQHEAEAATESYNATREKLKSVSLMVQATTTRVTHQRARVLSARQSLGRLAAETYKAGDLHTLAILLGDDPEALLAASGLRATLSDRQAQAVARLVAAQRKLDADQAELESQRRRLSAETARQTELREQILGKLAQSRRLLSRLDGTQREAITRVSRALDREALEKLGVKVPADGRLDCQDLGIEYPSARVKKVLDFACAQLGKPYQWGGDGPGSYDCSGLTMAAWAAVGVSLPHNAAMQARYGTRVSASALQPGDLLFFSGYSHMGMYLGKGLMIHAPHTGDVVRIAPGRLDRLLSAVRL